MKRIAACIISILLLGGSSARADDADAARKYRLLGDYAVDCALQPSKTNPHLRYAATGPNTVSRTLRMTPELDGTFSVSNVTSTGPDSVQYREAARQEAVIVSVRLAGNTLRSWHSITVTGKTYIKDGKFVSSGGDTPTFTRCNRGD